MILLILIANPKHINDETDFPKTWREGHITHIILDVPYSVVMPPSAWYQIQLILLHISRGKTEMALFSIETKDSITFTLCNKYIFYTWVAKIRNMVTATLNVCRYTNLSFIWYKPETIIVRKLRKNKSYQGNLLINLTPFLGSILTYYLSYWLEVLFPSRDYVCHFFSKISKSKYSFLAKN